jgi:hypothetical protein
MVDAYSVTNRVARKDQVPRPKLTPALIGYLLQAIRERLFILNDSIPVVHDHRELFAEKSPHSMTSG